MPDYNSNRQNIYQVRIKGYFGQQWSGRFGGMRISHDNSGNTLLTGHVIDQPALHALFRKLRDLGISLLSVNILTSKDNLAQPRTAIKDI